MIVHSPLLREKAGLAGTKDLGLKKVKDLLNEWIYRDPKQMLPGSPAASSFPVLSRAQLCSHKILLKNLLWLSMARTLSWHARPSVMYPKSTRPIWPPSPPCQAPCNPQNYSWAPNMPSLSLFCAFPRMFFFLWNVLSSLAISTHSSLKTQLKCQLIPQSDVIFIWAPTTQCTLSWHLTFYVVLWIWRGSNFPSGYWRSNRLFLWCQPRASHLLLDCHDSLLTCPSASALILSVGSPCSSKCDPGKTWTSSCYFSTPNPTMVSHHIQRKSKLTWPSRPHVIWPHLLSQAYWPVATLFFLFLEHSISASEPLFLLAPIKGMHFS